LKGQNGGSVDFQISYFSFSHSAVMAAKIVLSGVLLIEYDAYFSKCGEYESVTLISKRGERVR
jgi:hypothetical protein